MDMTDINQYDKYKKLILDLRTTKYIQKLADPTTMSELTP